MHFSWENSRHFYGHVLCRKLLVITRGYIPLKSPFLLVKSMLNPIKPPFFMVKLPEGKSIHRSPHKTQHHLDVQSSLELLPGGLLPNYARGASKKSPLGVVGVGMSPNHATYMYISTHLKQFPHKNIKILYQKHLKKWLKYV